MDIQTWHGVLESHHSLLNKHLETISLMQQNVQDGSDAAQMLQSCVNQTATALQTFKVAAYRFMAELHSQALPQPIYTVEAKLKEKEEKMWKRMVKKRKRSPGDIDGVFQEQTKTPLLAKLRKNNLLVATKVGGDNIEESALKSQSGNPSNDASHVRENLPRAGAKKRGATRSKGTVTG
ncbi:hypothetical protein DV736_g4028, partial [Chaetothyriales sp. CBS 134916]